LRASFIAGTFGGPAFQVPAVPGGCLDEAFSNALLKHDFTAGTVQARVFGMDATVGEAVFVPAAPVPPAATAT
jgi:carotenoid cleavage dioxygenase-like enzyme